MAPVSRHAFGRRGVAPALRCFSRECAVRVHVAPEVGAVLTYLPLAHWWHAVWCDVCVVSSLAACIAP